MQLAIFAAAFVELPNEERAPSVPPAVEHWPAVAAYVASNRVGKTARFAEHLQPQQVMTAA